MLRLHLEQQCVLVIDTGPLREDEQRGRVRGGHVGLMGGMEGLEATSS